MTGYVKLRLHLVPSLIVSTCRRRKMLPIYTVLISSSASCSYTTVWPNILQEINVGKEAVQQVFRALVRLSADFGEQRNSENSETEKAAKKTATGHKSNDFSCAYTPVKRATEVTGKDNLFFTGRHHNISINKCHWLSSPQSPRNQFRLHW